MDLTQSVALAYMIAYACGQEKYGRIPDHLLFDVYKESAISVGEKEYEIILEKLEAGFCRLRESCRRKLEESR